MCRRSILSIEAGMNLGAGGLRSAVRPLKEEREENADAFEKEKPEKFLEKHLPKTKNYAIISYAVESGVLVPCIGTDMAPWSSG